MNLPNKLTLLRVLLIPFFIFFLMTDYIGAVSKWIALGIFCAASLTDFFDGYIARKYNLVTNFGKFMDPLADKLLVCSAIICFTAMGRMPAWIVIVIVAREFIISGFRLIAAEQGIVIAASMWGKFKTATQMIMIIVFIMDIQLLYIPGQVLMYAALALTVISLVDYIAKNRNVMKDDKEV
ncbi:MAG: CDP-diacylglycerol--glycerol-3-phosphate 3-phosphatidyltransferase [Lachnospiraceae bacterium]|nr:CDP-diacylglycerol--glycerol-3-phosphate 3-phosphatidyltransferase [Lachnospiraceae bacterium]